MSAPHLEEVGNDLGLPALAAAFSTACEACPDPAAAPSRIASTLQQIAAAVGREFLVDLWRNAPDGFVRVLVGLASTAPFLLPILARRPSTLRALAADDLRRARTRADFEAAIDSALREPPCMDPGDALRRVKYDELARITLREASLELVPFERSGETLLEISDLADGLLARALDLALQAQVDACGRPCWRTPDGSEHELPFVVFGLGKLGSQELNYSSDVDLVYAYGLPEGDGITAEADLRHVGSADDAPAPYFTRVAQEFHRLVTPNTETGFLYRIDLDLRPEGSRGALVMPGTAILTYFEGTAATWERAAYMKARPVAGDLGFGWRIIRELASVLYRSTMDYEGVAAIKSLKEQVAAAKGSSNIFNVKLGPGGIRDVESVAQAMQLLHGGRIPQIRQRSTQATLEGLRAVAVLPAEHADGLLAAYWFYRRIENRLQMYAERQTHTLPADGAEMQRVARSLGFAGDDAVAGFSEQLEQHRAFCRERFSSVFTEAGAERVLGLFLRHLPKLLKNPVTRPHYERLATQFGREIEASSNSERALVNVDRFLEGLRGRRFYMELLLDRPELVRRLAAMFAASEYLSAICAAHPRLIEPIFNDPQTLLLDRAQLDAEFRGILAATNSDAQRDPTESFLESLRLFHHRAMVNVGLVDLDGKVDRPAVESALTEVAETCLDHSLELAALQLEGRASRPAGASFLVVGMGKLGSRELTYGSDLDVIFLYDVPGADEYALAVAQEYFARLAQKLIWALTTPLVTGVCYEVDARLRPSGGQGTLVTSVRGFRAYHARGSQIWERQALLRARGVSGDGALAEGFDRERREILLRPLDGDPAAEIDRIRRRMEGELARETRLRHDFKTGHGGLLDVESVVQLLQLRHARSHPQLLDTEPIAEQITKLCELGLLPEPAHATLAAGWKFLQRLSNRLRIVANRSISDLDEERGDLDALAFTLGYRAAQRSGGARRALLADYQRHTSEVRAVYETYFRAV